MAQTMVRHRVRIGFLFGVAMLLAAMAGLKLAWSAWGVPWATAKAVAFAKERLGRDLSIAHLDVRWSLKPVLIATGVALGNPSWAARPHMLRIGRAEVEVDLRALLSRSIRVDRVQLEQLDLLLETGKGGEPNWHFRFHKPLWQRIEALPSINLRAMRIEDARIGFRDGQRRMAYYATLRELAAEATGASGALRVHFAGVAEGKSLSGDMMLGSLLLLRDPDRPYPVDATFRTHNERARIAGSLQKPLKDARFDLKVSASGRELADTVKVFGITVERLGAFRVSARLVGPPATAALRAIDAAVKRDGVEITLCGAVDDLRALDRIRVSGSARITDRAMLGRLFRALPPPPALTIEGQFTRAGRVVRGTRIAVRAGQNVLNGDAELMLRRPRPKLTTTIRGSLYLAGWPQRHARAAMWDKHLPGQWLRGLDADLDVALAEVAIAGMPTVRQLRAQVSLADGHGLVAPLSLRIAPEDSEVIARLIFDPDPEGAINASLQVVTSSLSVRQFLDVLGEPSGIQGGRTIVDVDIKGKGKTLRELFSHLNGEATVVIGETQLMGHKLDFGADLLTRLLTLAMPSARSENTIVQCAAVRLPILDGVVTIDRSAAIETKKVTIVASGVINLRDNRVQLFTRTRASTGFGMGGGIFTDVVQVEGSLDQPRIGISNERALNAGLSIGAAVATGGFTWLAGGILNRFVGDPNPCSTALTGR